MAEIPHQTSAKPPDALRERKIKRDFLVGLALTFLFILLYQGLEASWIGSMLERLGHSLMQHIVARDDDPPITLLNIVQLEPEPAPTLDPAVRRVTPRRALLDLVAAVAEQHPAAIGIDIDFSSSNGGFLVNDDQKFFDALLKIQKDSGNVRVFLGVARAQEAAMKQPDQRRSIVHWLGDGKYDPMAASILLPTDTQTLIESFSISRGQMLFSMSAVLADAYRKKLGQPGLIELPRRPWSWLVESTAPWKSDLGLSGRQYLMDYRALAALTNNQAALRTISAATIRDQRSRFEDKIVLLGDDPGARGDAFNLPFAVPGIKDPYATYAGAYFHASGAYTLLRPLFWLRFWPRTAIDMVLCIAVSGITLGLKRYYLHRMPRSRVATHRVQGLGFTLVGLVVLVGVLLARFAHVVWDDWVLVILALWAHPMIERRFVASWIWGRTVLPRWLDRIALDHRAPSILISATLICVFSLALIACGHAPNGTRPGGREAHRPPSAQQGAAAAPAPGAAPPKAYTRASHPIPGLVSETSPRQGPGSCLVVVNKLTRATRVDARNPTVYEDLHWDIAPATAIVLADNGADIKSPDGHWRVHTPDSDATLSWNYEADRNKSQGCNGSWVLTIR